MSGIDRDLSAELAAAELELEKLNSKLARKAEEIEVIEKLSKQINSTLDLSKLFDIILDSIRDLFGFQHSLILLKDEGLEQLSVVAGRGYESDGRGATVSFGHGVIGVVAAKRRMMRMAGMAYRGRYAKSALESSGGSAQKVSLPGLPDVQCQIAIPLLVKEELIGVLSVESPALDAFDSVDEVLLTIVGNQMGAAIANARAYQIVEEMKANLELRVRERTRDLESERENSERLLRNILPAVIAEQLKQGPVEPLYYDNVSVLFTDFVGFTKISEQLRPDELVRELDGCFSQFDAIAERYGLEKLKTIGDAYMCVGGVPTINWTHGVDACIAALEFQRFMTQMAEIKASIGLPFWELRVGIHSGPVTAGVIGARKFAYDVWGDTVNVASRMESAGCPGAVNISAETHALVSDFFAVEARGEIEVKGKGQLAMYYLKSILPELSVDGEGLIPNERFFEKRAQLLPSL